MRLMRLMVMIQQNAGSDFEILEFYGDSVLYERISSFLIQTRRFMSPHLMTVVGVLPAVCC